MTSLARRSPPTRTARDFMVGSHLDGDGRFHVAEARLGGVATRVEHAARRSVERVGHHPANGRQPLASLAPHRRDGAQERLGVRVARIVKDGVHRGVLGHPPRYTATLLAISATTPRSWVISMMAMPICSRISRIHLRLVVTSSAVVGSSAMSRLGRRWPWRSRRAGTYAGEPAW